MADQIGFHDRRDLLAARGVVALPDPRFTFRFENFFHPFVGEFIERVNKRSVAGLLDPDYQAGLAQPFFESQYQPLTSADVGVESFPKDVDVREGGPYANYNWELLFHVPFAISVHLSNNQRFAEAQRWMHFIFDPTCNDTRVPPPARYWRFLRFRQQTDVQNIGELLELLSRTDLTGAEANAKEAVLEGYAAIQAAPFDPHRVAATRTVAYQYAVVMKYLDNLIAWGDSLFREDTAEAVNEATQRYVLASNILGPRPQELPPRGVVRPQTFAQLRQQLDVMGNAMVKLEGQFPFNLTPPPTSAAPPAGTGAPLGGIGRTLYFCVPRNDRLLAYWDTVADRLYKVRNCLNLSGVARQLALFDPAIDPGLLVKAAAAGIDPATAAAGLASPTGPLRGTFLLRQALELCTEVRGLGSALLSAIEKGEAEALALLRQGQEIKVQQLIQDVRFMQLKHARATTDALVRSREVVIERRRYYGRLLGITVDQDGSFAIDRANPVTLTPDGFDAAYATLVSKYDPTAHTEPYPPLKLAGAESPTTQAGANGPGTLNLIATEDQELNQHLPAARDLLHQSMDPERTAASLALIPGLGANVHFWGLGIHSELFSGHTLAEFSRTTASIMRTRSSLEQDQGAMAARTSLYERRADEWMQQYNLAGRELMQIGAQILASLLAEQATERERAVVDQQVADARAVDRALRERVAGQDLYGWMQGELTRLYYEYYRFALDVARNAERTMKLDLRQPAVDAVQYIRGDYWNAGRQGLLSAEALLLDLKRLELAYHENRQREYELVRHVSLLQLDPMALMRLKTTGSCEITVPESLFDLDCPGHYMRRIKQVRVSIPAVTGPYTSVSCTLSLLRSSIRAVPTGAYPRHADEDDRFVDFYGAIQAIVTSHARNDSGLFDANPDERYLPFENAGAVSSWKLDLGDAFRQFDYDSIADVVLHVQYTAREGGETLKRGAVADLEASIGRAEAAGMARMFSVAHEFPGEWAQMKGAAAEGQTTALTFTLGERHYPYWSRDRLNGVASVEVVARTPDGVDDVTVGTTADLAEETSVALMASDALGTLLHGFLPGGAVAHPTGEVKLFFDRPDLDDLWVVVTWTNP